MKTKFVLLAAALMISGVMFAQEKKCDKLTPEQMIEKRVERMQKRLMLDDATAAKFAPVYKEYLQAKSECRPACDKKCENPTDAQIKEGIEKRMDAEQKALDVDKKYYKKLSSILSGRQLQVIFCKGDKKAFNKKSNMKRPGKSDCKDARGKACSPKGKACPQGKEACPQAACDKISK